MAALTFRLNDKLYLRDPQHTTLGRKIIESSVEMIDRLGFEQFTFKKLADEIHSTEASVYRYFENKHRLLHYLVAWYWNWLEYRIDLATTGVQQAEEKLRAALQVISEAKEADPSFEFVNEEALHRIVIAELDKTFLTKWVDTDNQAGLFGGFKSLCKKIAGFVVQVNPEYPFSHSLVSTVLVAANQQLFFIEHLPSLSDIHMAEDRVERHQKLMRFLEELVFNTITPAGKGIDRQA